MILLALVYFLAVTGSYGVSIWLPTILQRLSGLPCMTVALISALPYLLALATMILLGWSSDRHKERRWHTALPLLVGAAALSLSAAMGAYLTAAVVLLFVAAACVWTYLPSFWALPTAILSESAAAASIGLINSVGNLGGFAGPFVVGYLQTATGSFGGGMAYLAVSLLAAGFLVLRLQPGRDGAATRQGVPHPTVPRS